MLVLGVLNLSTLEGEEEVLAGEYASRDTGWQLGVGRAILR